MGTCAPHAVPVAELRNSGGDALEQRARRFAGGRRLAVAWSVFVYALGHVGQPHLWAPGDLVGDLDLAALSAVSRDASRHEGRGGHVFSSGDQSAHGARLAVFATVRR